MKIILGCIILYLFAMLASCSSKKVEPKVDREPEEVKIVVIDDCQYLMYKHADKGWNDYSVSFTHKGNCNNPIHNKN